jgi:FMN phosphatase YigB (HAD superfamily)
VSLPYGPEAVDAILFDLDDVLVPFQSTAAWQWAWKPQGPVLGERRVHAAVRRALKAWDRRRWEGVTGRAPPADLAALHDHLRSMLFEVAGHPLPDVEAEAVVRRLLRPAGEVERFPDVAPALERLRAASIPWGVATPLPAGDVAPTVPDRAGFRAAAERLHFPVERVAYVGDLFWSDVRAANRAGLPAILLDRHDAWPKVQVGRMTTLADLETALAAGGSPASAEPAEDGAEG